LYVAITKVPPILHMYSWDKCETLLIDWSGSSVASHETKCLIHYAMM